jgi:hypothetical protein
MATAGHLPAYRARTAGRYLRCRRRCVRCVVVGQSPMVIPPSGPAQAASHRRAHPGRGPAAPAVRYRTGASQDRGTEYHAGRLGPFLLRSAHAPDHSPLAAAGGGEFLRSPKFPDTCSAQSMVPGATRFLHAPTTARRGRFGPADAETGPSARRRDAQGSMANRDILWRSAEDRYVVISPRPVSYSGLSAYSGP